MVNLKKNPKNKAAPLSQCLGTIIFKDICADSFSSLDGCYLNKTQTLLLEKNLNFEISI